MSGHTPGPWVVCEAHKGFVISNDKNNYDIAVVRNIGSQNNEANARLIAAAPELLNALLDFVETMDSLPKSDETSGRVWENYHKASAAVAKAFGQ